MTPAVEVADRLYERWNNAGLSVLTDSVDPAIELICDPLRPAESVLRGVSGWEHWVARWDQRYHDVHVTVDALVPMDPEHVLAFVSISGTPTGTASPLSWAAAHLWTLREGRIAGWEPHLDLAAARRTLDA
jgi:ketosteroid isomerase-like protein